MSPKLNPSGKCRLRGSCCAFFKNSSCIDSCCSSAATLDVGDSLNPGLSVGDTFHILFASSGTTVMNQNSPVVTPAQIADAFVQNAADNTPGTLLAGLGTWSAVAFFDGYTNHPSGVADAVQEHARDHALVSAPAYRSDGVWLADGFAGLWDGDIAGVADGVGPSVSETGGLAGHTWTWTGSDAFGFLITPPFGCPGGAEGGATFGCGVGPQSDRTTVGYNTDFLDEWMDGNLDINSDNNISMYGLSEVITITEGGLPGDFDNNGVVDAADFTVWQDNMGLSASALNGNGSGAATAVQADYLLWKINFEALATGLEGTTAVPEPTTLLLALAVVPLRVRCGLCVVGIPCALLSADKKPSVPGRLATGMQFE